MSHRGDIHLRGEEYDSSDDDEEGGIAVADLDLPAVGGLVLHDHDDDDDVGATDVGTAEAGTAEAGAAGTGTVDGSTVGSVVGSIVDTGTVDTSDAGTVDIGAAKEATVGTVGNAKAAAVGTLSAGTVSTAAGSGATVNIGTVGGGAVTSGPASAGTSAGTVGMSTAAVNAVNNVACPIAPTGSVSEAILPTSSVALSKENFPFMPCYSLSGGPAEHAIVRMKNIPFSVTRAEVVALFGRKSNILNDVDEPVHIIMDRISGKTYDAYAEFVSMHDAKVAVEKLTGPLRKGKPPRLGRRHVYIVVTNQADMMRNLFPFAKVGCWREGLPLIGTASLGPDFNGFWTEEELHMLVKHVEFPHKSKFTCRVPQRPYECMISTLRKAPWYVAGAITISQRNAMHKATMDMIRVLKSTITRMVLEQQYDQQELNSKLLMRLGRAAMTCPGFSVTMKDNIAYIMGFTDAQQREFGQPLFGDRWIHLFTLIPKPSFPLDVVERYIAVIRDESNACDEQSLRPEPGPELTARSKYFGNFGRMLRFPPPQAFEKLTLDVVAAEELSLIETLVARSLERRV